LLNALHNLINTILIQHYPVSTNSTHLRSTLQYQPAPPTHSTSATMTFHLPTQLTGMSWFCDSDEFTR
jgi:hypothetical protein